MASTLEALEASLPNEQHLAILIEQAASTSPWQDYQWNIREVMTCAPATEKHATVIDANGAHQQWLYRSLPIHLHQDECESYYHNLTSPQPCCYVVASNDDENNMPTPYLATLSFDEAHAYLEGDESIFSTPIPATLYQWVEAFIVMHYAPEKRKKRKRKNWKKDH